MRTALLAALARTDTGELRAELELGGRSVLAWQVELARALECERIVCLCDNAGGEVLAMQRMVERAGGQFHAIRGSLQLASIVRADDELVMLLDGLVPDRDTVIALTAFSPGSQRPLERAIATLPAVHDLARADAEAFERIDRERSWAGIAVMRAAQVHKLADLPPDGAPMSLLLRLALQAGVPCRDLPVEAREGGNWVLADGVGALSHRERMLIEAGTGTVHWTGPGTALGQQLVQAIAPRWIDKGPEISALGAIALALLGALVALGGWGVWGLGLLAIGALAAGFSRAWSRLRAALWKSEMPTRMQFALAAAIDLLAVVTLVMAEAPAPEPLPQVALAALAVGLARYLGTTGEGAQGALWGDRGLHIVLFTLAAASGLLAEALALFALAALVQLMLRDDKN